MLKASILAGAAAVPAAALAATPMPDPGMGADPIFDLIEQHKKANAAFAEAARIDDELRMSLPDDVTRDPRVVVGEERELHSSFKQLKDGGHAYRVKRGKTTGKFYYAKDLEEIERNAPKGSDREPWIGQRLAELERDAEMLAERQAECGLTAAEEQLDKTDLIERAALRSITDMPATTATGCIAALTYLAQHVDRGNDFIGDLSSIFANLGRALSRITGQAQA